VPNKVYDVAKWVAIIGIPAFVTFYNVVSETWGWPYTQQITATITALGALLGAWIGVSAAAYSIDQAKYVTEDSPEGYYGTDEEPTAVEESIDEGDLADELLSGEDEE